MKIKDAIKRALNNYLENSLNRFSKIKNYLSIKVKSDANEFRILIIVRNIEKFSFNLIYAIINHFNVDALGYCEEVGVVMSVAWSKGDTIDVVLKKTLPWVPAHTISKFFTLKMHPEHRRGGDCKSGNYKTIMKNQSAIASVGFAKAHAEKFGTSERTIITKTKIGGFILDGKLKEKTVGQFSKRKLSQRKVLEEIKAIEPEDMTEENPPKKDYVKTQSGEKLATIELSKKKEKASKSKEIVEYQKEEHVNYCIDCKFGLQLSCPSCKDAFISCTR